MKTILIFVLLVGFNTAFSQIRWTPLNELKLQSQFDRDLKMYLETLFPSSADKVLKMLDKNRQLKYEAKITSLKKVFLIISGVGLKYTTKDNDYNNLKDWPFPIVAALSHGQRIIFHYDGNIDEVFTYIFAYKDAVKKRIAASHGMELDANNKPIETKLKGLQGNLTNLKDGITGHHNGMSFSLGGIGNINGQGFVIGPGGHFLDQKALKKVDKTQHGHMYIRIDQLQPNYGTLLLGVEGSAPGKTNMWGAAHTAASGSADQTKELSPTGGQKWGAMKLPNAPAEYGGKHIYLSKQTFNNLKNKINLILPKLDKNKWSEILKNDGPRSQNIFNGL